MAAQPRNHGAVAARVDPLLHGWLFVVLGGTDALLGRVVDAHAASADGVDAEAMIRAEMAAGRAPCVGLRPVYALGAVALNTGLPGHLAKIEQAPLPLVALGHHLGAASETAVTFVMLTCFQFCADWEAGVRTKLARRLEESLRYAEDAARGFG